MRTDTRCVFCGGFGELFGSICRYCEGSGRRRNTLTPFLNDLDDVALVVGIQARFMEDVANIGLQEMCRRFDREWAARERHERKARLFKKLYGGRAPELDFIEEGPRSYAEQVRLYRQWVDGGRGAVAAPHDDYHGSHNLNGMAIDTEGWVPAEHVEHDRLRDLYRAREPWHFEYAPYGKQSWRQRLSTWWYVFRYKRGWLR